MTGSRLQPATAQYLDAILLGDHARATDIAAGLVDSGLPFERVVVDVVAPAQAVVGERWVTGEVSVAEEHRATATSESVVSTLEALASGTLDRPRGRGRVLVTGSEREWHVLPVRMVAAVLRLRGFDVLVLPPIESAQEVAAAARSWRPDVVALACSRESALVGAWRCITAAHAADVPVLCGGRAFGCDEQRALALGADAWCADVASAPGVIDLLKGDRAGAAGPRPGAEARDEALRIQGSLARISAGMVRALAPMPPELPPSVLEGVHSAVRDTVLAVVAAVLVDEPDVAVEHARWIADVLTARGVPVRRAEIALAALRDHLPSGTLRAREATESALMALAA